MSVGIDPKNPDMILLDCRPWGSYGKRVIRRLPIDRYTLEDAQRMHDSLMRQNSNRRKPPVNQTIASLYKQWMVYYVGNRSKSTVDDAKVSWKHLKEYFGPLFVHNLTQRHIEGFKAKLLRTVKYRTVNKHLSYFSSMLTWAVKNGLCDPLPFKIQYYENKLARAPKPRPISQEQITKIYNCIEDKYRLIFLLMADAGLRRSEALKLKREDVEYDSGLMFITGKGNKERIVPVTTSRLKVELIKKVGTKGYFSVNPKTKKPYYSIRKALERAAKNAGLDKHVYHHLLRHSFGTNATIAGVSNKALQSMMGHGSQDTTQIYQHLAGDVLRSEGSKLDKGVK